MRSEFSFMEPFQCLKCCCYWFVVYFVFRWWPFRCCCCWCRRLVEKFIKIASGPGRRADVATCNIIFVLNCAPRFQMVSSEYLYVFRRHICRRRKRFSGVRKAKEKQRKSIHWGVVVNANTILKLHICRSELNALLILSTHRCPRMHFSLWHWTRTPLQHFWRHAINASTPAKAFCIHWCLYCEVPDWLCRAGDVPRLAS